MKRRRWTPVTVILITAAIVLAAGYAQKSPCLHTTPTWSNGLPYKYACYSDVIPLYGAEGLDTPGVFPYEHSWIDSPGTPQQQVRYMEYPVLTGLFMWMNAQFAMQYLHLASSFIYLPSTQGDVAFFAFCALFAAIFWLISVWCITRMTRRRPWDGILAAASPLVVMQAFTNFDMMAVGFATTGLYAWSRRRTVLAGALIGLGTAAKLYPVLLLIPLLALCLRAGKLPSWLSTAASAGVTWTVVNAPIAILFPRGWFEFIRLNNTRGADPDSLYNVAVQFTNWGGFDGNLGPNQPPTVLNAVIAISLTVCVVAIVLIALSAPRRPRVAQLSFLIVSAFLITNKVWSPQYSLWLIPLAVLAVPRWKPLFAWMFIDAALWIPRMYFYLGTSAGGWSQTPFLDFVIVRDSAVAALCGLVIYEIYHPARDLVRQAGDDDPAGGVLDGAPDVFVLRWDRIFGRLRRRPLAGAAVRGS